MPNDQTPEASVNPTAADSDSSSADASGQTPSSDAMRHPTGASVTPSTANNAVDALPGAEIRSNTGMFPVQSPLRKEGHHDNPSGKRLAILTLTALGVVYGDIGTSPLYALKECFSPLYGIAATRDNVFGILSLIVWALTLVVTVKYVNFILRADNRGEGGTFALLALIFPRRSPDRPDARGRWIVALALFGTALLYGDGIITPDEMRRRPNNRGANSA
jgi:KUP system potassium uptake protein